MARVLRTFPCIKFECKRTNPQNIWIATKTINKTHRALLRFPEFDCLQKPVSFFKSLSLLHTHTHTHNHQLSLQIVFSSYLFAVPFSAISANIWGAKEIQIVYKSNEKPSNPICEFNKNPNNVIHWVQLPLEMRSLSRQKKKKHIVHSRLPSTRDVRSCCRSAKTTEKYSHTHTDPIWVERGFHNHFTVQCYCANR